VAGKHCVIPYGYADTINTFKHCLDKFWSDKEVLYDYNSIF